MNKFICVEGVDGVGKSTAIRLASERKGAKFIAMKSPPERMSRIRPFYDFSSPEARFFFYLSAGAEVSKDVRMALVHSNVCCDRYLLSTIAYHNILCGKKDLERHLDLAYSLGLEFPEKNIVILADRETRAKRIAKRLRETSICTGLDLDLELTEMVQREYIRLSETGQFGSVFIDSGKLGQEEVAERILLEFE